MKLSSVLKLGSVLRAKIYKAVHAPEARNDNQSSSSYQEHGCDCDHDHEDHETVIILEEKKKTARFTCYNCGHTLWVKRGTKCYYTGLCDKCVRALESVNGIWSCPAFDKLKQRCSRLGEFISNEIIDSKVIDPRCPLEDIDKKD